MSVFMPTIEAIGLIDSPPESNVIPLPTSARCTDAPAGAYSRRTSRGPRLEPCPTARIPPKPSAASAASSQTFAATPAPLAASTASSARRAGKSSAGEVLTRSLVRATAAATARTRSSPTASPSSAVCSVISSTGVLGLALYAV